MTKVGVRVNVMPSPPSNHPQGRTEGGKESVRCMDTTEFSAHEDEHTSSDIASSVSKWDGC